MTFTEFKKIFAENAKKLEAKPFDENTLSTLFEDYQAGIKYTGGKGEIEFSKSRTGKLNWEFIC